MDANNTPPERRDEMDQIFATQSAVAVATFHVLQRLIRHLVIEGVLPKAMLTCVIELAAEECEASANPLGYEAAAIVRRLLEMTPFDTNERVGRSR